MRKVILHLTIRLLISAVGRLLALLERLCSKQCGPR